MKKIINVLMVIFCLTMAAATYAVTPVPDNKQAVMSADVSSVPIYVDAKWEVANDGSGAPPIMPVMDGTKTVRICAVVCDANGIAGLSGVAVNAKIYKPSGETYQTLTLPVGDSAAQSTCNLFANYGGHGILDPNCQLYSQTFDMQYYDAAGYYTVAVWADTATEAAVIAAANRLVAIQNTDGGFDWVWDNTISSATTQLNVQGVTGMGIYEAYKMDGDPNYLVSMNRLAVFIKNHPPTTGGTLAVDKNSGCWQNKDVLFLAKLAMLENDNTLAALAKSRYDAFLTEAGGEAGLVTFYKGYRAGAQGDLPWDVDAWIQAAYALNDLYPGYSVSGNVMANELSSQAVGFFSLSDNMQPSYYLGLAGMIEAYKTTGSHLGDADTALANLKAGQKADGAFTESKGPDDIGTESPQTTSYAVMALKMAGEKQRAVAGTNWLKTHQASGHWISTDNITEYNEETSEGAWGMADSVMAQNRFKYMDLAAIRLDSTAIAFGSVTPGLSSVVTGDLIYGPSDKPTVQNIGNVKIDALISGTDLAGTPSGIIPISNVQDQFDTLAWTPLTTAPSLRAIGLAPGTASYQSLSCSLTPPAGTPAGSYIGNLNVDAVASA